jgi:type IV secretion system protein VirD4
MGLFLTCKFPLTLSVMNFKDVNIPLFIIGALLSYAALSFLGLNLGFGLFGIVITGGISFLGGYATQKQLGSIWSVYKKAASRSKIWIIPDALIFLWFVIVFSGFSLDSFFRGGWPLFLGMLLFVTLYARMRTAQIQKDGVQADSEGRLARIKDDLGGSSIATQRDLEAVTDPYGFYTASPYYHWFKEGHIITVGGSGSGKGACMLIPSLISPKFLETKTSVFCFDPKGENYAVAKGAMERAGYQVFLINPMNILKLGSDNLNVFDLTSKDDPNVYSFCRTIAESLAPSSGDNNASSYFAGRARGILIAYMLYMLDTEPHNSSFGTLFDYVTKPNKQRAFMLDEMAENMAFDGAISREAHTMINSITGGGLEEVSSVYTTCLNALSAFQDVSIRRISKKSDFSLMQMFERPTAIFLSVKLGDIDGYAGWIRTLVRLLTREIEDSGSTRRRTLFILDEFPQLGYMKDVVKGFETLRGFGATFHIVLQDLERLKGVYPKEYKSFLSNSSVKHIMGLDDLDMAKVFSEISGTTHNVIDIGDGENINPHIKEKPVIPADEFLKNWDTHYLLIKGMPNFIKMPKMKYFENPYFKGQYGQNPYY